MLSGTSPQFFGGTSTAPIPVRATDSAKPPNSTSTTLNLDVFGVVPTTLLLPQVGQDFTQQGTFVAAGGTLPIKWTLSGTPPPGLVFQRDPAEPHGRQYQLAGSPTRSGSYQFSISVSDSGSPVRGEILDFQVQVEPAVLVLPHLLLPPGVVGESYAYQFVLQGGAAPYQWTISLVQLPGGLQFNSQTGDISGTPSAAGYANFIVSLSDSSIPNQQSAQQSYWLLVTPNPLPARNNSIANATPIFPGTYNASISPYGDPPGTVGPDEDYYSLTAEAGTTFSIFVGAGDPARPLVPSTIDAVVEILDSTGQRYSTCNDPFDDNPPVGVPIAKDPTPDGYDDPCMNHGGDPVSGPDKSAQLGFRVPGSSGDVTFYLHVFDFWGDARPDMFYTLTVQ